MSLNRILCLSSQEMKIFFNARKIGKKEKTVPKRMKRTKLKIQLILMTVSLRILENFIN